jgi:AcrR family transcriptional regulator
VSDKGYASTTIADIVAHARVSKRTFYEHFVDKEECLMALYARACELLILVIRGAGTPDQPWRQRVAQAVGAYLSTLEALPGINRTLLVEIQAAGPRAYRLRQEMLRRIADTLVAIVEESRPANPELTPLSPTLAVALVGGINELLLQAVDPYTGAEPAPAPFTPLHDEIVRLISAVLIYRD